MTKPEETGYGKSKIAVSKREIRVISTYTPEGKEIPSACPGFRYLASQLHQSQYRILFVSCLRVKIHVFHLFLEAAILHFATSYIG